MSTHAKIENITPIINDPSAAENAKSLQVDDPLDELIEAIRETKLERSSE
jgi:hypothetical protein